MHLTYCYVYDLQVTLTRCKFSGFRRVLDVQPGSQGRMERCVVDVAIPGSYGGGPHDNLAVGACSVSYIWPAKTTGVARLLACRMEIRSLHAPDAHLSLSLAMMCGNYQRCELIDHHLPLWRHLHCSQITARGEGALLHMTNCQLSISCTRICALMNRGFLQLEVWLHVIQAAARHAGGNSLAALVPYPPGTPPTK
jgi:hypothetical protein